MQKRTRRLAVAGALAGAGALAVAGLALAGTAKKKPKMMTANTGAKIAILSPKPGQVITGNTVHTDLAISHFKLDCGLAGTAPKMGVGHYHIHLDGALVNMFCGPKASVSLANVKPGKHTSFPQAVKLKADETVVFSWIVYKSRKQRDSINAKVMADPRLASMMDPKSMPFDGKRFMYGGFKPIVNL